MPRGLSDLRAPGAKAGLGIWGSLLGPHLESYPHQPNRTLHSRVRLGVAVMGLLGQTSQAAPHAISTVLEADAGRGLVWSRSRSRNDHSRGERAQPEGGGKLPACSAPGNTCTLCTHSTHSYIHSLLCSHTYALTHSRTHTLLKTFARVLIRTFILIPTQTGTLTYVYTCHRLLLGSRDPSPRPWAQSLGPRRLSPWGKAPSSGEVGNPPGALGRHHSAPTDRCIGESVLILCICTQKGCGHAPHVWMEMCI